MAERGAYRTTRRAVLAGAAAGAVMTNGNVLAQSGLGVREKGPRVWLDMDQAELDAAYDQTKYAPNMQTVIKRYAAMSEAVRKHIGPPKRLAYGASAIERLDVYTTKQPNAPIALFIHGGAWRQRPASGYGFPAEMFVNAGAHFVAPDFISVEEGGGDLMPMIEHVRRAIAWVAKNAQSFGGDPTRIYLSGHSSGAHLAGVALTTDWSKDYDLPGDVIKAALLMSGMYDLAPVRLSARSNYVKFTDAMEEALSTQRHLANVKMPIAVSYGGLETPEFIRQARDFAAALKAAGKPVTLIEGEHYNHFEILETLASPYGLLGRVALSQMNLIPA